MNASPKQKNITKISLKFRKQKSRKNKNRKFIRKQNQKKRERRKRKGLVTANLILYMVWCNIYDNIYDQ